MERPQKIARVIEPTGGVKNAAEWQLVPFPCRLLVLEYLGPALHVSYCLVSQECHRDSLHPSLPLPIHPLTIDCSYSSLFAIVDRILKLSTTSPKTNRIKLVQHGTLDNCAIGDLRRYRQIHLKKVQVHVKNITSLNLSVPFGRSKKDCRVLITVTKALSMLLSNLVEVDCSNMISTGTAADDISKHCPKLSIFRWHRSTCSLFVTGQNFGHATNLTEVYLDDTAFYFGGDPKRLTEDDVMYLFVYGGIYERLKRVSILNATVNTFRGPVHRISQKCLISFVLSSKKLRWFRSDLTSANVTLLKKHRPDVVFAGNK